MEPNKCPQKATIQDHRQTYIKIAASQSNKNPGRDKMFWPYINIRTYVFTINCILKWILKNTK